MRILASQRGASTLEVIAALAIFALAAAGLSIVLPMAYGRARLWNTQFKMARVLEKQLEDLRHTPFDDIPMGDSGWQDSEGVQIRHSTSFVESGTDASARPTWIPATGGAGGLHGVYYDDSDFTGLSVTRIDPNIDFNWGKNAPHPLIRRNKFSVRWTGYLQIPTTGSYVFYTRTSDGARLWIDHQLVIDRWVRQNATEWSSGSIALTAGVIPIRMEMFYHNQEAAAHLSWQGPSIPKQIIPPSYFSNGTTKMTEIAIRPLNHALTLNGRVMHYQTGIATTPPDVSANIELQMKNNSLEPSTNTLYPWFMLFNNDDSPLDLNDITIRYYYTVDGEKPQFYHCDHAGLRSGHTYQSVTALVSGSATPVSPPVADADYYVEIRFDAITLPPEASVEIQGRIRKSDWTNYTQANDYSFSSSTTYIPWTKATVYKGGQLIWGIEP